MPANSPFNVRTRVCNNKCAPSLDHCICCFLQKRLLTTSFTVDSTNPVAIGSPLRYLSPSFGITCRLCTTYVRNADNALTNPAYPRFKGVWSTAVNFAPLPLLDTRSG